MASDSDLEAYLNQLSRKSHNLQNQSVKTDSPSLSNSLTTPTFNDDDDDLHSRKVSSKQNFQKKKVETIPGSLLDIKSLSEKYSKRKPEIVKKDTNISFEEETSSSYYEKKENEGRINNDKVNLQEYIKHNAVSKKPKSKVIDDDSSMDEELARYLNETSLHDGEQDEEINMPPQYDVKKHSSSDSSSSGSPMLNMNNLHTLDDILGTRSNDNSESIIHDQVKSNRKKDLDNTKNKPLLRTGSIQIATQDSFEGVVDDEKGSLLRNLNSTSIFYSKGQTDNSSLNKIQIITPQNVNQISKQNKEITTSEAESVSVIEENEDIVEENEDIVEENEDIVEENEDIVEENEDIVEESILESDSIEDSKSKVYSEFNNTNTSNINETISESSESGKYSYIEREIVNEECSSSNNILEKSDIKEEIKARNKSNTLSEMSKKKLSKTSETGVSSVEETCVNMMGHHKASSLKKKSLKKEPKTCKNKKSESEKKGSNKQKHRSRHKKKKRYTRSSSSSHSDSSLDSSSDSSFLSDSELLEISKKLYQKPKHKTHSSYSKKRVRKFPEWNYSTYTPSVYGIVYPPQLSGIGSNNFGIVSHNAIMRQQVELTRMFLDSQRSLYSAYTSVLHSNQHFTTIKDTEKYIKKKRKATLTFEEALKLVKEERKSSH